MDSIQIEDGSGILLLEDDSGSVLLETGAPAVPDPGSTTTYSSASLAQKRR